MRIVLHFASQGGVLLASGSQTRPILSSLEGVVAAQASGQRAFSPHLHRGFLNMGQNYDYIANYHSCRLAFAVNESHIKALWMHFEKLGARDPSTKEMFITRAGFQEALGYKDTPNLFLERVFNVFDSDGDNRVSVPVIEMGSLPGQA